MRIICLFVVVVCFLLHSCSMVSHRVKSIFPDTRQIDSLSGADTLITARIHFDLQKIQESVENDDSLRINAFRECYSLKELSQMKALSQMDLDYYHDILTVPCSIAVETQLYPQAYKSKLEGLLFGVFANKPYFSDAAKIKGGEFESTVSKRVERIKYVVSQVVSVDSLSLVRSIGRYDSKSHRMPIALFLGKNGDSYCWVYVEAWERKFLMGMAIELEENVDFRQLDHIEVKIYDQEFKECITSFKCD